MNSITKQNFEKLSLGNLLNRHETGQLIHAMLDNELNEVQVASVLAFFQSRNIMQDELEGMIDAVNERGIKLIFDTPTLDVCGTGGDGKNTFNISTLSAFVLAATGVPVAKYGNFGSTSVSGSSDILNYFGYGFTANGDDLLKQLDEHNLCFLHAPLFHPALKKLGGIRKEIGFRTLFNLVGPLTNPVNIAAKYVGVYNLHTARLYHYHLQSQNLNYTVVTTQDGYDEISLTDKFKMYSNHVEKLISPADLNLEFVNNTELASGQTIAESAKIFLDVLSNKTSKAKKMVVLMNAATAYCCYHPSTSLPEALAVCTEAIDSGRALEIFKKIIST
ncbi:MAG: anthranilate phosphoribosyltransferase [Crocinitomicaceae bacterium]|nr:anthranilate phosphoribosyltransferase [Crocinitomicaceae bacterium]